MSILLEDLTEEATVTNRRVADRLAAEIRDLEELRQSQSANDALRQRAIDSARLATDHALSGVGVAEREFRSSIGALRQNPARDFALRLLALQVELFEIQLRLTQLSRQLWSLAERLGATPDPLAELDRAASRFQELAAQARQARDHRSHDWQPSDPDRLALGLKLAGEAKTIPADKARERFRKPVG